ncbi:hypothetical protein BpHYR1_040338 [Brachionus plicatilis]|uniref:CCHC-type domain-containing protein n=1 Tax=Brachionus plicatilis TaxID=10195 RepID=A0A3M7QFA0_BRAPC|nr:hypothetical protein BpHYR1_040338 [Brachionus plicatilis]
MVKDHIDKKLNKAFSGISANLIDENLEKEVFVISMYKIPKSQNVENIEIAIENRENDEEEPDDEEADDETLYKQHEVSTTHFSTAKNDDDCNNSYADDDEFEKGRYYKAPIAKHPLKRGTGKEEEEEEEEERKRKRKRKRKGRSEEEERKRNGKESDEVSFKISINTAPAPEMYIKDSVFKPAQFNRRTDLETWWKRFELYISSTKVSSANLRNTLLVFLDDDCMAMFDYCIPITPMGMTDLFQHMKRIFGKTEPVNIDAKGIFYTRVQKPNEDVRAFFTSLWKLAKSAFKTDATVFNVDGMVKVRFINGLNDPYLIMQLTSNKMFTKTSFEALEATLELVNRLESWKTNSQVVMSPMTQRKQVGFHDELLTKAHEAPVSEDMRVCFICRKPGHKAAYCRENRNPSAPTSQPRTVTNAVINNVMMNDSIIGKCFVNGNPVHFLFDTGTVKTIIADRIWRQCKKVDSKLIPNKSTIETCSGGPIEIKAALGGKTLEVKKKAKTPLKATLPEIYRSQASVNATNFNKLPLANGDPEEPAQDEDEKKKVEAYSMILHD